MVLSVRLYIISRHYKNGLLRSQIYHGYDLSTNTNYPIWRRQERSKYVVQLVSWQLRSNSRKMSACHTFFTMFPSSYHHEFSEVITIDRSDVHAKGQGQKSKVRVRKVKTLFSRFRTVSPVWIHIWRWNDAQSLMWHRRGALLFFEVTRQISRSHRTKNRNFWPDLGVSRLWLQFEFTHGYQMMHIA